MMDCRQAREVLDCYVDGELSPAAGAAVDAHLAECRSCAAVARQLRALKTAVRRAVAAHEPSAELRGRVNAALGAGRWLAGAGGAAAPPLRWLAVAALLTVVVVAGSLRASTGLRTSVADALDGAAIALAGSATGPVEIVGTLVCRDCELEHTYGEGALCAKNGHRGAIATRDGRIWNIVEQPASLDLVHNPTWLGRTVRVRARLYRHAGTAAVEHYTILG
jgi:hypothetical protein